MAVSQTTIAHHLFCIQISAFDYKFIPQSKNFNFKLALSNMDMDCETNTSHGSLSKSIRNKFVTKDYETLTVFIPNITLLLLITNTVS